MVATQPVIFSFSLKLIHNRTLGTNLKKNTLLWSAGFFAKTVLSSRRNWPKNHTFNINIQMLLGFVIEKLSAIRQKVLGLLAHRFTLIIDMKVIQKVCQLEFCFQYKNISCTNDFLEKKR